MSATGRDANAIRTQAVRGQLLFKPDDTIQMRVIADFSNFQAYCCTQVYLRTGTSLRAANRQFGGPNGLAAQFGYVPPSTAKLRFVRRLRRPNEGRSRRRDLADGRDRPVVRVRSDTGLTGHKFAADCPRR